MFLIDSHCHLESIKGFAPSDNVLPITCGYSHTSNLKNIEIARKFNVPFCLGIAPQTAIKQGTTQLEEWCGTILKKKPNAIGEIGLDYHWAENDAHITSERVVFDRMISLAEEMDLPVVIHSRKAENDALVELKKRKFENGIMMHFFSGTVKDAELALSMGAILSIICLHSKSRKDVIKLAPLESLVIETDAPYVGRKPEDVIEAAKYVAEVKGLDVEVVASQTAKNAAKFFKIKL
ncbi:TPA: TatD family hydrolase [Candidatus Micrarchaeota archaeon]|nr:TatD family hydrolase [Candidatus Micrarchaeota archaeon]